ncbi:GTPase Era [Desulforamulus hydrothermalis]|uniref:GTPase Era n=1 Tax=Desulforamulus hydrothermalis Lam5 = DSM 18033 TaxID=1121428 RepID=K8EBP7_9FIRM|nr:GTPase Era [Desulforamulus hydrothermalis]CCO09103.1 GTPase Era [Desulforamulus hydrothermalis Lam5 = DSM 18033]SHH12520.1 GTP-binding protein Era [Desulforamulus hydrothermalis Lam5 = DSM 18033]
MLGTPENFRSGFVALVGRPNVGKSTLLNKLVGQKVAIMSDKPQTTRHKIHSVLTRPDAQIVFLDTPGIHKPRHKLGEYMVEVALNALKEVDVVLFLVEATDPPGAGDRYIAEQLKQIKTPVFLMINKIDLVKKEDVLASIVRYKDLLPFAEVIPVSALAGDNVERLIDTIVSYLPAGPQYYPADMITDRPERFIMAEIIREKVLHLTSEEVPHSVAVVVEQVQANNNGVVVVNAVIYTERDSQKAILIGKGGAMLKEVGRRAREEIENLLGSRVYLELWVKVKKDWRNKMADLRNFGFTREE